MRYSIKTEVEVVADYNNGDKSSTHVATNFTLIVSKNLKASQYINEDGMPTQDGSKAISETLIQGLIGNIHLGHEKGWRDSAEHLRDIIQKLEIGFAEVGVISKGEM